MSEIKLGGRIRRDDLPPSREPASTPVALTAERELAANRLREWLQALLAVGNQQCAGPIATSERELSDLRERAEAITNRIIYDNDQRETRLATAEGLLRRLEWSAHGYNIAGALIELCPSCRWPKVRGVHEDDCQLAAFLSPATATERPAYWREGEHPAMQRIVEPQDANDAARADSDREDERL